MQKSFSTLFYFLFVVLLSWPFQFWYVCKAETAFDKYLYSSLSMLMVAVATFIAGRFVYKDGFANAGWNWGKPKHYIVVLLFVLFIWLLPVVYEITSGINKPHDTIEAIPILSMFLFRFVGTLAPAFGEELGWRGYILPRLAKKFGARNGLLIHAFIWWCWHLPVLMGMSLREYQMVENSFVNVTLVLLVSIIPSMLHAIIFAFIWSKTKSLAVVTVYHAAFDEVRDALENSVGFGLLVNNWQMIVIIIAGGLLLWKANWEKLLLNYSVNERMGKLNVKLY